jgi:class 3 adenylate cyclase
VAELARRSAAVVPHFGCSVEKFTGDRINGVFGAPVPLENNAFRVGPAALDIHKEGDVPIVLARATFGGSRRYRDSAECQAIGVKVG